jgi:hypothetical protein
MTDHGIGRRVFKGLVEYPLPQKRGVFDYVFFVPEKGDGYRDGASGFFKRFYPHHVRKDATSLEALIAIIDEDIERGRLQHVREIVIVAHGTHRGLQFPVLSSITEENKGYKDLTALSLAWLQRDLSEDKFRSLRQGRERVIAHLTDESWVTIRACRFGLARDALYALYSFFGGRANVYAPTQYQFFGPTPVRAGMRFENTVELYDHLVKQRYFPRDIHSRTRKETIVAERVNAVKCSDEFAVASMAEDAAAYRAVTAELNRKRLPATVTAVFADHELFPTRGARVQPLKRNRAWRIDDRLRHGKETFEIQYHLREAIDGDGNAAIWAKARLTHHSKLIRESDEGTFALQLFFRPTEQDLWKGKLFRLAVDVEGPRRNARQKARYDDVEAALNRGQPTGGKIDLIAEFLKSSEQIELTQPRIRKGPSSGEGRTKTLSWIIEDREQYLVKSEPGLSEQGELTRAITVYRDPAAQSLLEQELLTHIGVDPDTVGTELQACLDRFTLDELASLVDYLRSPVKPEHLFYIHQAQQAMNRKQDFFQWLDQRQPDKETRLIPGGDGYTGLSPGELEAKHSLVYPFEFKDFWREVKASSPSPTRFRTDLFSEESLARALEIDEASMASRTGLPDLPADSPFSTVETDAPPPQGLERFFVSESKDFFDVPDAPSVSCEEFEAVIKEWKQQEHLEIEDLHEWLGNKTVESGATYLEVVLDLKDTYGYFRNLAKLSELVKLPPLPSKRELVKQFLKRVAALRKIVWLQAILEVDFVVLMPADIAMKFLEDLEGRDRAWEYTGRVAAMRQWVRELNRLTYKESGFPDDPQIDVSTSLDDDPYYVSRYHEELRQLGGGRHNLPSAGDLDRMKKGFDFGVTAIEFVWFEMRRSADRSISEFLRASGLTNCQIQVLIDMDILDRKKLRAHAIREMTIQLLDELPVP